MRISVNSTSAFNYRSTNCSRDCNFDLLFPNGWVTERSIVHAWKACVPKGTRGSNPRPSAIRVTLRVDPGLEFPAVTLQRCRPAGHHDSSRLDQSCNRGPEPRPD